MAAIELVDDRYDDYRSLGTPTLIADDFFQGAFGGSFLNFCNELVHDLRQLEAAEVGTVLFAQCHGFRLNFLIADNK